MLGMGAGLAPCQWAQPTLIWERRGSGPCSASDECFFSEAKLRWCRVNLIPQEPLTSSWTLVGRHPMLVRYQEGLDSPAGLSHVSDCG